MTVRHYAWNGYAVTASEFADRVSDLLAAGWRLVPPSKEADQ